jgi:hypothetical protein
MVHGGCRLTWKLAFDFIIIDLKYLNIRKIKYNLTKASLLFFYFFLKRSRLNYTPENEQACQDQSKDQSNYLNPIQLPARWNGKEHSTNAEMGAVLCHGHILHSGRRGGVPAHT